jgi:hypothetical protein
VNLFLIAKFAYNNAPHATTGVSSFYANKGYHPNITVHPEHDLASTRVREFVTDLDKLYQELKKQVTEAQHQYQGPADCWRSPAPGFQVGQHIFINAEHIHTTCPSKKLSDKNLRPYEIIAKVGSHSFTLQLPDSMCAIHPVFHVFMLEPATLDTIPNQI